MSYNNSEIKEMVRLVLVPYHPLFMRLLMEFDRRGCFFFVLPQFTSLYSRLQKNLAIIRQLDT